MATALVAGGCWGSHQGSVEATHLPRCMNQQGLPLDWSGSTRRLAFYGRSNSRSATARSATRTSCLCGHDKRRAEIHQA